MFWPSDNPNCDFIWSQVWIFISISLQNTSQKRLFRKKIRNYWQKCL